MSPRHDRKSTPVIAVDTGGTFTDFLLVADGVFEALKLPSTPDDPAQAVLQGVQRLLAGHDSSRSRLILGSTVATNTLLERDGARVVLVTNEGFEDVIEIGRQNRPQLYALTGHRLPPLVAPEDRLGISGRLGPDGAEVSPIDEGELARLGERLREAETVAVVLLHSYANPAHEKAVEAALEGLETPVSMSFRILPEFREFERASTTVANAYVAPRVRGYLSRLQDDARTAQVRVMGSSGGALPLGQAIDEPVHTVLSGPAGGVVGAIDWGRRCGIERIVSFDMGGTSTDVSLVPGAPLHTREGEVGGVPIAIPLTDIHTVGAGGGSIVRLDPGGVLRVGPESAGADPGPISYGRGGRELTVTDAHVFLGRIPTSGLLGGAAPLDRTLVTHAVEELARETGLTASDLAEGIIQVADTAMERALRVISIERGVDPADYQLVAFGGAAGLHAAELTERLNMAGAIIPPEPGLLSAFGILVAPVVRDLSRTLLLADGAPDAAGKLLNVLDELETEGLEEMLRDGADRSTTSVERHVDARYLGQSFELRVPAEGWVEAFHSAHELRYGYRRDSPVEAVTARVRLESPGSDVPLQTAVATPDDEIERAGVISRGREIDVWILGRSHLPIGSPMRGPGIVTEYSSTTWCPPGWILIRDEWGVLHLSRETEG